ncbi:uncharacterized protein LOC130892089 [Diorhabda carinulata]|uniref:uncharacterized protein LOC130444285 n=1 Tax=Diorhabda sublineata TaxID=1163346 RepID=UPI0024E1766D|nr:uncharacterized protein LOC130444285 [Diorhabda sublineata]XP_057653306.1 uncharacterized protein LOC130892089 [Diorhabda carinulata]
MQSENELTEVEESIQTANDRIKFLEKKLKNHFLPKHKQKDFKRELSDVKKLLVTHQLKLVQLKTRDKKLSVIAVSAGLIVVGMVIYMFYTLIDAFVLMWDTLSVDN